MTKQRVCLVRIIVEEHSEKMRNQRKRQPQKGAWITKYQQ